MGSSDREGAAAGNPPGLPRILDTRRGSAERKQGRAARVKTIKVTLPDDAAAAIATIARMSGIPVSTFARALLLAAVPTIHGAIEGAAAAAAVLPPLTNRGATLPGHAPAAGEQGG